MSLVAGQAQANRPLGLLARAAPRKCARGRDRDSIFVTLSLRSRTDVPENIFDEYTELVAATYFGVPGSVTAALREASTAVNARLLDYNLKGAAAGRHVQGHLIACVLRGEDVYIAQSGAGFAIVMHAQGLERYPVDAGRDVRPLGIGQALDIQYSHTQIKPREVVILSTGPAPGWDRLNYTHYAGLPLDELQLRLTQNAQGDGSLLAIRFEPAGSVGQLPIDRPASPAPARSPRPESPAAPALESAPGPAGTPALSAAPEPLEIPGTSIAPARPEPAPVPLTRPAREEVPPQDVLARDTFEEHVPEAKPGFVGWWKAFWSGVWPATRSEGLGRGVGAFGRALGVTLAESFRGLRVLLARMMPEGTLQKDGLFTLPPSVMMSVAVIFPLVVVAVIVVVYVQLGRGEQYRTEFARAQVQAAQARTQPDGLSARPFWETALRHLELAESYQQTSESYALRREAQGALDQLDGTLRLEFSPTVVGGLGREARISRLLTLDSRSFYALDAASNTVWRAVRSTAGHDLDDTFDCSGGVVGQFNIGTLVDIAELPAPNPINTDAIVGLDPQGRLLYCAPNQTPLASELLPPATGWQSPRAIEVYVDRLYVLDPGANEVWQYVKQSGVFSQPPSHYFSSVSYDLSDVIDLSIADGDLYLLHADGHLTVCSRGANDSAPSCTSPAEFVDQRAGRSGGAQIDGAVPLTLTYDPPPQPALYLLDTVAAGGSVYQYSLRLVFQAQYRPLVPVLDRIDAIAINPEKQLFIASGNQVFFANLP